MAKNTQKKAKKSTGEGKLTKRELKLIKAFQQEEGGDLNLEEMLRKNNAELDKTLAPKKSKKQQKKKKEEEEEEEDEEIEDFEDDEEIDDDDDEDLIDDEAEEDDDDEDIDDDDEDIDDEDLDDEEEEGDGEEEEEEEEETEEQYKKDLETLEKTDPELYEYLKKHDPSVLDFNEDEDEEDAAAAAEEEEDEEGENDLMGAGLNLRKAGNREPEARIATAELLDDLEARIYTSPKAVRKYLIIYRSACHINDAGDSEEDEEGDKDSADAKFKKTKYKRGANANKKGKKGKKGKRKDLGEIYKIPSSAIFDRVITFALTKMRSVFERLLKIASEKEAAKKITDGAKKISANRGEKVNKKDKKDKKEEEEEDAVEASVSNKRLLAEIEKNTHAWASKVSAYARSFLVNSVYFLEQLTDDEMKGTTLRMLEAYTPFIVSFPPLLRKYFTLVVRIWTSGREATRLLAFSSIHEVALLTRGRPFSDTVLRTAYLAYVRNSQQVSGPTVPLLRFLRNCIAELFANAATEAAAYRVAFTYIRQLAIHLRSIVVHTEKSSLKDIHNWQFINALRVWCDVLAAAAPKSEALAQLVYPVLQLIAGVIEYTQGARNAAIRFHCIRMSQRLAAAVDRLQNPIPHLLQCLEVADMKKRPKPSMAKKIDLETTLLVGKLHMGTPQLHEFIADNVYEIMFAFLAGWSYKISFAEMALPALVFLRRFKKICQNPALSKKMAGLIEKIGENIAWMNEIRAKAGLTPKDFEKCKRLEEDLKKKREAPLAVAWSKYSRQRNLVDKMQRKKDAEEARRNEELKRKRKEEEFDEDDEEEEEEDFENMKEEEYENDFDDEDDEKDEEEEEEEEEKKTVIKKKKNNNNNKKKKEFAGKKPQKKRSKAN